MSEDKNNLKQLQHVNREIATAITDKTVTPGVQPGEPGVKIQILKGTKGTDQYEYRRMVDDDGKTIGRPNILKNGTALNGDVSAEYVAIKHAFGLGHEDADKSAIEKAVPQALIDLCKDKVRRLTISKKGIVSVSAKSKKVA